MALVLLRLVGSAQVVVEVATLDVMDVIIEFLPRLSSQRMGLRCLVSPTVADEERAPLASRIRAAGLGL